MLYTREGFDAKVILLRIAILQILFYLILTATQVALVVPYYASPPTTSGTDTTNSFVSIILDWTTVRYSMYSFQGIMTASSYALTSIVMGLCTWKVIKRSSTCADFSCTMYVLHVIVCWLYNKDTLGFPTSIPFWFCMGTSGVTTAVIAERLCMREELEEIPLTQFVKTATGQEGADTIINVMK